MTSILLETADHTGARRRTEVRPARGCQQRDHVKLAEHFVEVNADEGRDLTPGRSVGERRLDSLRCFLAHNLGILASAIKVIQPDGSGTPYVPSGTEGPFRGRNGQAAVN
eukprot:4910970-Heterocapsa_arctica.AAC.1